MSISNIRTITPSLTDIKDYTPVLKIGDKYLVNGIGGDFIPVKGTVIEDATATASDIIEGKIAYNNDGKVTGTYKPLNITDATAQTGDILEGKIAYNNEGKVTGTYKPLDITDATATASDIIEGKTAYISSGKITGTYVPSSSGSAFYKCSAVYQAGASTPSTSSSQNFKLTIPPVNDYAASYDFYIQDGTATGKNRVWKIDKSKYPLPYSKVTSIYFRQIDNFWVLQTEDGIRFTSQSAADNPWDKTNWMDITTSGQCQFSFQMHSSGSVQGYTLGFHAVCQMEGMTPETVDYIFTMQDTSKTGWERTWVSSDGTLRLQAKVYIQQTPGSDVDDSARTWFITSQQNSSTNVWEANQWGSDGAADPWGETEMMYAENGMSYNLTWTPQSGGGSSQSSNSSQPQGASWSGYKAILSSGKYSFSTVETTGLTYTAIKPVVGGIYTQDALAQVARLAQDTPSIPQNGLVFHMPFTGNTTPAVGSAVVVGSLGSITYNTQKGITYAVMPGTSGWRIYSSGTTDFSLGSSYSYICYYRDDSDHTKSRRFLLNMNLGSNYQNTYVPNSINKLTVCESKKDSTSGQWHFLCIRSNGSTASIKGTIDTYTWTSSSVPYNSPARYDSFVAAPSDWATSSIGEYWQGGIFDFAIYNRILTDEEVTALYQRVIELQS